MLDGVCSQAVFPLALAGVSLGMLHLNRVGILEPFCGVKSGGHRGFLLDAQNLVSFRALYRIAHTSVLLIFLLLSLVYFMPIRRARACGTLRRNGVR